MNKSLQSHSSTKKGFNMYLKITSILLLLSCLNITLADQDCKVKLYAEQEYQGNHVETIYDSISIKHDVVKSLLIFGDCKWDMYRQLFYKDFPFSSTYSYLIYLQLLISIIFTAIKSWLVSWCQDGSSTNLPIT